MYDLIGDIHGHATELKQLLEKLGFRLKKKPLPLRVSYRPSSFQPPLGPI